MAFSYLFNLMLAVAVKGSPLNGPFASWRPVKIDLLLSMANEQITSLELRREANNKGANLGVRSGSIDMGLEVTRWARVNLFNY
jgi:hypothetical protein